MDQPKIERLLRLMKMMSGNINYTIDALAERLDMSERTIYRYIDTFKSAGFTVTKIATNTYKLEKVPRSMPQLDRLLYFSEEEAYLVNSLIDALVPTNALKKDLGKKLAVVYDSTAIAHFVADGSNAAHVEALRKASKEKKKVVLRGYESGNSHTVRDRLVEPYGFTTDFIDVCALDLEDGKNKIFKVQRISGVEILDEPWTGEANHRRPEMDIFRMTGEVIGHIHWRLSLLAKNLLVEEYPLAGKCLRRSGDEWVLKADLCSYVGACRFFMGLSHEICIVDSPEFLAYVKEYAKKNIEYLFKS